MTYSKMEILSLRNKGMSQREIALKLGCCVETVKYHCNPLRAKKQNTMTLQRKKIEPLIAKLDIFKRRVNRKITSALKHRGVNGLTIRRKRPFSVKELRARIGDKPICYLTGKQIDTSNPSTYSLDHIIPVCQGGSDEITNIGICLSEANMAKSGKTVEEFLRLCKLVLEYNGFEVKKLN